MIHPFDQKAQERQIKRERQKKRRGKDWKKQPSIRRARDRWLAEGRDEDDYATRSVEVQLAELGVEIE